MMTLIPKDIENAYSSIPFFPISLATVPFVYGDNGNCTESYNKFDRKYHLEVNAFE